MYFNVFHTAMDGSVSEVTDYALYDNDSEFSVCSYIPAGSEA
jgi:hypothetical protein